MIKSIMIAQIFLLIRLIIMCKKIRKMFSMILVRDYQFQKFIIIILGKSFEKKKKKQIVFYFFIIIIKKLIIFNLFQQIIF